MHVPGISVQILVFLAGPHCIQQFGITFGMVDMTPILKLYYSFSVTEQLSDVQMSDFKCIPFSICSSVHLCRDIFIMCCVLPLVALEKIKACYSPNLC